MKLLVVDDEKGFREALKDNLEQEGYSVDITAGGRAALDALKAERYALVVLDVMMPDMDGFSVLEELRKTDKKTPVIFLTARSLEEDKLQGLELGADDYLTKPFSVMELIARIRTVLRRTAPGSELGEMAFDRVKVDLAMMTVTADGCSEDLGRYEAEILRFLASEPGRVFSRDEILDQVWGLEAFPSNRTVDNYIVKIRQHIESDPRSPKHLVSVYGKGYKLALASPDSPS